MKQNYLIIILLILIAAGALYLRAGISYDAVFAETGVRFLGPDPYHHMRLADNIAANFPHVVSFDPYLGDDITVKPMLSWMIVAIASVFSNGQPSGEVLDTIGAWIPAICGMLLVVPVYFIGRELFNKWAGVMSAAIIVILPGEILGRTSLGYTDHHCLEVLLSCCIIMFLLMALRRGVFIFPCLLFLGLYLGNWQGGLLFVGIVAIFLMVRLYLTERLMFWVFTGIGATISTALLVIVPTLANASKHYIGNLIGVGGAASTISEVASMNWPMLWGNFNVCLFLAIGGLIALGYITYKEPKHDRLLFLIWTIVIIAVAMIQRKYAYYLAINIAVLSGYMLWLIVKWATVRKLYGKIAKRKGKKAEIKQGVLVACVLLMLSFVVYPNVRASANEGNIHPYMINDAWVESLQWLRNETPEPFDDVEFYYADYDEIYRKWREEKSLVDPQQLTDFEAPLYPNVYKVMSWWDYGHWIIREARRPIMCSPAGGFTVQTAECLLAQNEKEATRIARKMNVRYVIVDYMMVGGKFHAIPLWADSPIVEGSDMQYDSFVWGLYFGREYREWKLVFESKAKYYDENMVRIFEYVPYVEPKG